MVKTIIKLLLITILPIFVIILIWSIYEFNQISYEKNNNPLVIYLEDKFHKPNRAFVTKSFANIPKASTDQIALAIGADIAESDLPLVLEKGYDLIAFESQLIYYTLITPNHHSGKVKIITSDWNFTTLPQLDIVMASFILPLFKPEDFQTVWQDINTKMKVGGYFIGNFFAPDWDLFPEDRKQNMTFHTKEQLLELFKDYEILDLEEVKIASDKPAGNDHYYEIFARKK